MIKRMVKVFAAVMMFTALYSMSDVSAATVIDRSAVLTSINNGNYLIYNGSYTTGLSPSAMGYILSLKLAGMGGVIECSEVGLPVTEAGYPLPCGSAARWYTK